MIHKAIIVVLDLEAVVVCCNQIGAQVQMAVCRTSGLPTQKGSVGSARARATAR